MIGDTVDCGLAMFRRCKNTIQGPATRNAFTESSMSDSQLSSPRPQAQRFAVVGQQSNLAGILALFQPCRPSTATRLVVSVVVVDPVYRRLREWFRPHIGKEVHKRRPPTLTDCDAPSAVEVILTVFRVVASTLHFLPCYVFRACAFAVRSGSQATTRLGTALAKLPACNLRQSATFTAAQPDGIAGSCIPGIFEHRQAVIDVPRLVDPGSAGRTVIAASRTSASNEAGSEHDSLVPAITSNMPVGCSPSLLSVGHDNLMPKPLTGQVFRAGRQSDRICFSHQRTPFSLKMVRAACGLLPARGSLYFAHYHTFVNSKE